MQFLARDYFAGAAQQQLQDLQRLILQLDPAALPAQLSGRDIQLEKAETDHAVRCWLRGHVPGRKSSKDYTPRPNSTGLYSRLSLSESK